MTYLNLELTSSVKKLENSDGYCGASLIIDITNGRNSIFKDKNYIKMIYESNSSYNMLFIFCKDVVIHHPTSNSFYNLNAIKDIEATRLVVKNVFCDKDGDYNFNVSEESIDFIFDDFMKKVFDIMKKGKVRHKNRYVRNCIINTGIKATNNVINQLISDI